MIVRLSKLTIAILFFIGANIYVMMRKILGKQRQQLLIIITYHSVKMSQIKRFDKQMNTLLKIGQAISLSEGLGNLKSGYNVAVTFDDAYQSILQNALPILRKKNIPATIFVPTGCLGKKPVWIKDTNHNNASEIVVTEAQLKMLPSDLITIGSHTVTHINLTNVDEKIARREIFESKRTLERVINKKVTLFAAPYATLNENFTDLFRQAGYQRVFLNIPTFPRIQSDLFIMGRNSVEPTDWPLEFYLKLHGAYQWLPLAINLKKKFIG
jgi:peptidoglycan/xylan/chitin deacetylase (PgdA/CDA1 family)